MKTYANRLLILEDEKLILDTAISEREAAQTKLMQYFAEPGVIVRPEKGDAFSFEPYNWTESYAEPALGRKTESVFVSGPAFDGVPLYEILSEAEEANESNQDRKPSASAIEKATKAVNLLCKIEEYALDYGERIPGGSLPQNGPMGILFAEDGSVLYLPSSILQHSLDSRLENLSSEYDGCWKNTALSGLEAKRFTLAAYAYDVLAGTKPFPEKDRQKRAADFFDHNFIPLEKIVTCEPGTKELFSIINHNLRCSAPVQLSEKKRKKAEKAKQVRQSKGMSEDLGDKSKVIPEIPSFSERKVLDYRNDPDWISFSKQTKTKRFFRKYSSQLKVGCVVSVILLFFLVTFIRDKANGASTKGLEPDEVVEMFYNAMNTMDTNAMDASRFSKVADPYSNLIVGYYVTSKVRESYESVKTYTPGQWLHIKNPQTAAFFGITNLNYTLVDTDSTENPVHPGYTFKVHYYLIFNEGGQVISVMEENDLVTVSWKSDRYKLSGIESNQIDIDVDTELFLQDLESAIQEFKSGNQAEFLIDKLGSRYFWLPTKTEAAQGLSALMEFTF